MSKGYFDRIEDIFDKMTAHTDEVLNTLRESGNLVCKEPSEMTEADIKKLQSVIIQAIDMLIAYNGKLYGTGV